VNTLFNEDFARTLTLDGSVEKGKFPEEIMAMISKVALSQFSNGSVEVVKRSVRTALKMAHDRHQKREKRSRTSTSL